MINALIFDFDGTLAATEHSTLTIYNELAERHGYKTFEEGDLQELRHMHWLDLLREANVPIRSVPKLLRQGQKIIKGHMESQALCRESIPAVLEELRPLLSAIGIISSNSKKNIKIFLKSHSFAPMDFVVSSPIFTKADKIRRAVRKFRLEAETSLYIGDELRDIHAARAAGLRIAAVTWGFNSPSALETAKPDYMIDDFSELLEIVARDR